MTPVGCAIVAGVPNAAEGEMSAECCIGCHADAEVATNPIRLWTVPVDGRDLAVCCAWWDPITETISRNE